MGVIVPFLLLEPHKDGRHNQQQQRRDDVEHPLVPPVKRRRQGVQFFGIEVFGAVDTGAADDKGGAVGRYFELHLAFDAARLSDGCHLVDDVLHRDVFAAEHHFVRLVHPDGVSQPGGVWQRRELMVVSRLDIEFLYARALSRTADDEAAPWPPWPEVVPRHSQQAQQPTHSYRGGQRPSAPQQQQRTRVSHAFVQQGVEQHQQRAPDGHAFHYAQQFHGLLIPAIQPARRHQYQDIDGDDYPCVLWRVVVHILRPVGSPQVLDAHETRKCHRKVRQRQGHGLQQPLHERHCRTSPDGHMQQQVEHPGVLPREVVLHEDGHRVVEGVDIVQTPPLRAFSFIMYYARGGHIVVLVSRQPDAPREVDILAVHEIRLVQQPHFLQCLSPDHQERAGQDIHLIHFVVRQVSHIVGRYAPVVGEQADEPADLEERGFRCRESPLALFQILPFAVDHLHAQPAAVRMFFHEVHTLHQRVLLHHSVRVQQQRILPSALPQRLVVGSGKSDILEVLYQVHLRITAPHHLHRPVHRRVVHHPNFQLKALALRGLHTRMVHRLQALLQEVLDVVVYYDDGQPQPFLFFFCLLAVVSMIDTASSKVSFSGSICFGRW